MREVDVTTGTTTVLDVNRALRTAKAGFCFEGRRVDIVLSVDAVDGVLSSKGWTLRDGRAERAAGDDGGLTSLLSF